MARKKYVLGALAAIFLLLFHYRNEIDYVNIITGLFNNDEEFEITDEVLNDCNDVLYLLDGYNSSISNLFIIKSVTIDNIPVNERVARVFESFNSDFVSEEEIIEKYNKLFTDRKYVRSNNYQFDSFSKTLMFDEDKKGYYLIKDYDYKSEGEKVIYITSSELESNEMILHVKPYAKIEKDNGFEFYNFRKVFYSCDFTSKNFNCKNLNDSYLLKYSDVSYKITFKVNQDNTYTFKSAELA